MNKSEFGGALKVMGGHILARIADASASQRLRFYSARLQRSGKTQIAVGQARKIIRHCVKRNSVSA
jgi:hypothetical protein